MFFKVLFFVVVFSFSYIDAKPLSILLVLHQFPMPYQTFFVHQIKGLLEEGHDVKILSLTSSKYPISKELDAFNLKNKIIYRKLPFIRNKKQFDIVYMPQEIAIDRALNIVQKQKLESHFVAGFHSLPVNPKNKPYRSIDLFLPCCNFLGLKLVDSGIDPKKIEVIHAAVDLSQFKYLPHEYPANGIIKLVTVARLEQRKGVDDGIIAVSNILKKYNVEYSIIGDGSQRNHLQTLICDLGVQDHVKLLGYRTPSEIFDILKESHLLIHPAFTLYYGKDGSGEGVPVAMMEAMAVGLPVISTYHSGIPELVENLKSGILVKERDIQGLEKGIFYLIDYAELWNEMGSVGRQHVEKEFDMKKENIKLNALLKGLVEGRR